MAEDRFDDRRDIRGGWGWFVALGGVLIGLGLLALANVMAATLVSIIYLGALMLLGAIAQVIHAFQVRNWGGFFFWLLSGLLYAIAGVIVLSNPGLAAATLTLLLALALVAAGVLRAALALQHRPEGWGWIVVSGCVTAVAGIIFAIGWPANTPWLLGLILAFDLAIQGIMALAFGLALRQVHAV